jgi:hypothetical protein
MINAAGLKKNATLFRKAAQEMDMPFPLCQLLDIYAYAHYGRAYAAAHRIADEQLLPLPVFPPPFLNMVVERYDVDGDDILDALEARDVVAQPRTSYATDISADLFKWTAKCFRAHAADMGIKLKMTAMNDFFSRAHFDRPYSVVAGALSSGNAQLNLDWQPTYLAAASAFFNVDLNTAEEAFYRAAQEAVA